MFDIVIKNARNLNEFEELIKIFIRPEEFKISANTECIENSGFTENDDIGYKTVEFDLNDYNDKNGLKIDLYHYFSEQTGYSPDWGILTGVRPVKLAGEIYERLGDYDSVFRELRDKYCLSEEKADLLIETLKYQKDVLKDAEYSSVGLYIGIPFCPTRCLYCSFTSNQKPESEIKRYLDSLIKEISFVGKQMKEKGMYPESIYIGGGTPTTLSAEMLDQLLSAVKENIDLSRTKEFTVEAGRPDTITEEKLSVLKKHDIRRISINPQSMKSRTLELIGRSHSPEEIRKAFSLADKVGFDSVNCDIIAGLPEETAEDFTDTINEILKLQPQNITVHTLAVKRASRLVDDNPEYHYERAYAVKNMLEIANRMLRENGYKPYYLYRQKHMAGNFENVGWQKNDTPCVYNVRIMDEHQHILALGAGGVSKIYFPAENRLERVANVSNYEIYIERLDDMLKRKEDLFFKEVIPC